MYKTLKISFAFMFATALAFIALLAYQAATSPAVKAQDEASEEEQAQTEEESADDAEGGSEEASGYTYTAQPGDTYTQIARKAVQTYGIDNSLSITQAGIVFAETNLTQEAGAGELAIGQEVTISEAQLKKWVDAAGQLSESEQAAWDVYVPFVNFNTDSVGENS